MSSASPIVDAQRVAAALAAFGHPVLPSSAVAVTMASTSNNNDHDESADDDGDDGDAHEDEAVDADEYDDNVSDSGDFDIHLAPRSPPYLRDFETRLSFLGDTIIQQYNRFMHLWFKYMRDNRLPTTGYDTRRIVTTDGFLHPFEVFRAVVQRGGYFRVFMLNPVNREFPPFDRETGQPLYAIPRQERGFEIGETFLQSDPAGQLPAEGDFDKRVYFMRDGLFLRNAMYLRNLKVYYERYLLGFENAYCWKNSMAKRPIYDAKAKASGQCKYDFSECVFEEVELPDQFRPSTRELRRLYNYYVNHPFRIKGEGPQLNQGEGGEASDAKLAQTRTGANSNSGSAKTSSLHFKGVYSMARTMQACFLSNPFRMNQSMLVELTHAMNYLMALSKQFATKMSDETERKIIEHKFETMRIAATNAASHLKPDGRETNVIVASHSLASLLPSASPNWYFDVLLLFENDVFSHLFDQLIHPRSIALRLKTMQRIEELGHSMQPDTYAAQIDGNQPAHPFPPHIPQSFTSSSSFFHLAPSAQKFFFENLMQNLNNLSYPNLTIAILTILQNFTFPSSLLQKWTEKHLADSANAGKKKEKQEKEKEETSEPSFFIATVRANLLKNPLLLDTLFDYIDTTSDSYPLSIQLSGNRVADAAAAIDDLDPDRFDIIDVPPVDNIVELQNYLDVHGADAKQNSDSDEVDQKENAADARMNDVTIVSVAATPTAARTSTGNTAGRPTNASSNRASARVVDSMEIDSDNEAPSSSVRVEAEKGPLPPQYLHLSPYLLVDDCRYLSLQILSNLVMDIPWQSSEFKRQYEVNGRNKLFWIEMAREMQAYDLYVFKQTTAFDSLPVSQQPQSLPPPPIVALEFLMSNFQMLLSMLHSQEGARILEAMLPFQQGEQSSARAVLQTQEPDFYEALMGVALTPRVQLQKMATDVAAGGKPSKSSAMTWHERVQMTALETVAQFLLISPTAGALFLRDKLLLSKLVRLMQAWGDTDADGIVASDNRSKRFRRTVAFVISALLTYVMNWESKQAKAQGVASSNALLLSMANSYLGSMFGVCAYDPDVSVILSRWTSYCSQLQQSPASSAPATPTA